MWLASVPIFIVNKTQNKRALVPPFPPPWIPPIIFEFISPFCMRIRSGEERQGITFSYKLFLCFKLLIDTWKLWVNQGAGNTVEQEHKLVQIRITLFALTESCWFTPKGGHILSLLEALFIGVLLFYGIFDWQEEWCLSWIQMLGLLLYGKPWTMSYNGVYKTPAEFRQLS